MRRNIVRTGCKNNSKVSIFSLQNCLPQQKQKNPKGAPARAPFGLFVIHSYPLTDPEVTPST